jgi:hypothetical protein
MSPRTYYALSRMFNRLHNLTGRLLQWHTSANWARVRK